MKRQALIVSVNRYPFLKDSRTRSPLHLKNPAQDGEAIAQLLEQATGELAWNVKRLPEEINKRKYRIDEDEPVTQNDLLRAINKLLKPEPQYIPEVALLFFAGHGLRQKQSDGRYKSFLATSDADGQKKWGISLNWLYAKLKRSPVKKIIVWLDCCHSGELLNLLTEDELKNWFVDRERSLSVITATRSDLQALGVGEHGVLTEVLLQALDPMQQPERQWVTNLTLTSFVQKQLETNPILKRQIPQYGNFGEEIKFWQGKKRSAKIDWGDVDGAAVFYGREEELEQIKEWILKSGCRLVALLGIGGIGKTSLAVKLVEEIQDKFEYIILRSLKNAPPLEKILLDLIKFFSSEKQINIPNDISEKISILLKYLQQYRCLVVLDNAEKIMKEGDDSGSYQPGYEVYGELLQRVGRAKHKSCLLLTSREKPREIILQEGERLPIHSLKISSLQPKAAEQILEAKGLSGSKEELEKLIERYGGHPLALKLVPSTIQELFDGNITQFLEQGATFEGIRYILDEQFHRLSEMEKQVMYWLAINREQVSISQLQEDIVPRVLIGDLQKSLGSLMGRSLILQVAGGFTQHPVIMEYITDRLIKQICYEIDTGEIELLNSHSLIKATAKDYVREIQIRLILKPIADSQSKRSLEKDLNVILSKLKAQSSPEQGYVAGNILNLLCDLETDLTNYDFSNLIIWQAYLQGKNLHNVNFAHSNLAKSVFTKTLSRILSVAFSPDGKLLATSDIAGEIRLWEVGNGQPLFICKEHTDAVNCVTFSPDGKTLASSSDDTTIRLWDVLSGHCLKILKGHKNWVRSVAFSPDGKILASGSDDQTIKFWSIADGNCLKTLLEHTNWVRCVVFSPDGKTLASSGDDRTVKLWDVSSGTCLQTLQKHSDWVRSVAFSSDGKIVASGSDDGTVRLWNVLDGECIKILEENTNKIRCVAFSPDGHTLASGGDDRNIRLWDVEQGICQKILLGHCHTLRSIAFSPDGNILASGSEDYSFKLWDVKQARCLKTELGYTNWIRSIAFSPDGSTIFCSSEDKTLKLWDIAQEKSLQSWVGHSNWIRTVAFSPDGKTLASGSDDKTIILWDASNSQKIITLRESDWVHTVAFSPDSQTLASGSEDHTIKLWNVSDGNYIKSLTGHESWIRALAFSSNGNILASGSEDYTVRLWNIDQDKCLQILSEHIDRVRSVAFSPDGKLLVSCSDDKTIKLWDVAEGKCLKTLKEDAKKVLSVAFSPDGQYFASSSGSFTVRLWDTYTGECRKILHSHIGAVRSIIFNPKGLVLASGSEDGTIKLWDINTGDCIKTLRAPRPYEGMNITCIRGLNDATRSSLKILGAVVK